MDRHRHTDSIDAYLTGQMAPEQARSFEQEIERDEDLAVEVEMQRLEHDAMERILEKELLAKFETWKHTPPPDPFAGPAPPPPAQPGGRKTKWWLPLLAVAILALTAIFFLNRTPGAGQQETPAPALPPAQQQAAPKEDVPIAQQPTEGQPSPPAPTPQKPAPPKQQPKADPQKSGLALAGEFYEQPTFSSSLKGAGAAKSLIDQAQKAFDEGRPAMTIELLERPEAGKESQVRYLRGHAYFKLGKHGLAATEFQAVAAQGGPNVEEAEWFLLLSYLAQGPSERSRFMELLNYLIDDKNGHSRRDDALKLKEEIL